MSGFYYGIRAFSIFFALGFVGFLHLSAQKTPYENSNSVATATYDEAISWYQELAESNPKVSLLEYGQTDCGRPLSLVVISAEGSVDPTYHRKKGRQILLINNGVHPGESCGVDASMMLARDLANEATYSPILENVVICIIPIYNIGGSLNRGCCSRCGQVGPEEYGFRGNARNLDLNRDFIKADSKNAATFAKIFHTWGPDVFIDTHTTNGADYPYVMTLIPTMRSKLSAPLSEYMVQRLLPGLFEFMEAAHYPMSPYVNSVGKSPEEGIADFLDDPRYSTGYTTLFNTIGLTSEAHMLKSFQDRVEGTYMLLLSLTKIINRDRVLIGRARDAAKAESKKQNEFPIAWELDKEKKEKLLFRGYAARNKTSEITGMDRIYYDQAAPWEKEIPYYTTHKPGITISKPIAYIIPQAWSETIERLKQNSVELNRLSEDVEIPCEFYYIDQYQTMNTAYEGHYRHYNTIVRKEKGNLPFFKGDYVVYLDQTANRYLVETLEPEAPDSWFNWNFFDGILMRKEYFSDYLFEDEAAQIIRDQPSIKAELDEAKTRDSVLAATSWLQLDFVYRKSRHYEPTHNRYPVVRLVQNQKLPLMKN